MTLTHKATRLLLLVAVVVAVMMPAVASARPGRLLSALRQRAAGGEGFTGRQPIYTQRSFGTRGAVQQYGNFSSDDDDTDEPRAYTQTYHSAREVSQDDDDEDEVKPRRNVAPTASDIKRAKPAGSVDLVLEDAKMVQEATKLAGPAYSVRFRNQGLVNATKFKVAVVTSKDGSYDEDAPKAIVEVPGLEAGESKDVVLRLPRAKFSHLILMIDADDEVTESDKENNATAVARGEL